MATRSDQENNSGPRGGTTSFVQLISPALSANGLIMAILLLEKRLLWAVAIAAGCAVGLMIYAALDAVMDRTFKTLLSGSRQEFVKSPSNRLTIGVLMMGKFVAVGILLVLFFDVMHLSMSAFVIGFLVTQIFVSFGVYRQMTKSKVTD